MRLRLGQHRQHNADNRRHDDDDRRADDRDSLALIGLLRLLRRINKPTVGLFLRFLYRLLHRRYGFRRLDCRVFRRFIRQKVHIQHLRQLRRRRHVRHGAPVLPVRHRLPRHVDQLRQCVLRHALCLACLHDFFAYVFHILPPHKSKQHIYY